MRLSDYLTYLPLAGSALAGLAAAALTWGSLHLLIAPLQQLWNRSRRRAGLQALLVRQTLENIAPLPPHVLYGVGGANWLLLAGLGSLGGWALTQFLFPPQMLFLRHAGLACGLLPIFVRRARFANGRRRILRQVRTLLADLALALRYETPARALEVVAERGGDELAYNRLRLFVNAFLRRGQTPEQVLERLAADLRSPEMRRLTARLQAARAGGASFEQMLTPALEDVIAESETEADAVVESAPERLQIPMILALLLPVVILLVFPLGAYIIQQITGLTR